MFDGDNMYPKGFHPANPYFEPDFKHIAQPIRRNSTQVKYYFIDFGLSEIFDNDEPQRVRGIMAQDGSIPELSTTVPYDPYAVDVYTLGNIYKKRLLLVRSLRCRRYPS